ncbi:LytR/AlgR family response regulator transcription factor [Singulisphaera acidiphila]|uniref:Response regulator of the LytR/AlgR family n=1 Tax=Singulisphaera acidiphila (strain ATCC BAA-1392 / DSM 18658 / VKM B-2454 / MOB10) TaxID=886293 RepID=L0DPM9_SINAD|nr:LytTR family DNA-binding domain-containing protein [Singulisphaera acidiphila]AGA30775.1 response regulator of the LytR/AlgR family [Singulisphaera acidiphila DSM 18658]
MIRVVVVEDESLARRYLNRLLVETGKVEVVGEASDGQEGFRLCVGAAPDAVFLDIQIPGPDGLSLAARLLTLPRPPLVVFVTAFAGHAIDAFKVEAVDYLLKPIDVDQVLRAVRRLEHRLGPLLRASAGDGLSGDRLPVRSPGEEVVCLLARRDILAVLRRGRRTWVHTATGEIPTHYPLKALADWLGGPPFLLLARDSVVNMDAVAEVRHLGDRRYRVHMADRCQSVVAVSRSGAARLAELLKPPV